MAWLTEIEWMGRKHHAIEYGEPSRLRERLGTENARIEITTKVAGAGLDALVRIYFPETAPTLPDLGGEHF